MKLHTLCVLVVSSFTSWADELTFTTFPGCFSERVNSVITATTSSGTHVAYPDGDLEEKNFANKSLVEESLKKIRSMEFNRDQMRFLEEKSSATGPDYCVLKYVLNDRDVEIRFPAALASEKHASLTLKLKKQGSYKDYKLQDLEVLLKNLREIQSLMASLATDKTVTDQPDTRPEPNANVKGNQRLESEGRLR